MQELILVGGGGHCKSVIDVIESTDNYKIVGILDQPDNKGKSILGYEIIGNDDDIPSLCKSINNFVITVGHIRSSAIRRKIFNRLKSEKASLPIIVASTARVSRQALIGEGTVIHHNAFVNADVRIGDCTIINTGAIVEHDSLIGEFCHLSTNSVVNGTCTVGDDSFIGSGVIVNNNVSIAEQTLVGSASVVLSTIEKSGTYCGIIK